MVKFNTKIIISLYFLLVILNLTTPEKTYSAGEGDSLFSGIQVHTINIRFSQPNYWDSLIYYYNQGNEQYIPATVIANGITFPNVGIRLKGNSSFSHPNNKKSFRLSFNEFVSGQKWNGLKGVHLNNVWNDPTFIREKLHLDFCRDAGIAAPRANYVRLSVNDTLFAFYSLIEHVDKTFLTSRYGNDEGEHFKAVDGFGVSSGLFSDFKWLGSADTSYYNYYELKSDLTASTWGRLISLIDTINHTGNAASSFPEKINLNSFYKAMAADILMGNMDAYVYSGRNFYFYYPPPLSKMEWIVWDASLSFGALPGGPSAIETLPVTYVVNDSSRPLFSAIINNPILKASYLNEFCNVFLYNFTSNILYPKIDSIAGIIRSYVYEDPRKMYTNAQFETNIVSDLTVSGNRKPGLKSFINLRKTSVQNQLIALGVECSVGISGETETVYSYQLLQNYPNPFNPVTKIKFIIPSSSLVKITVRDLLGKEISVLANENYSSGSYEVSFDGSKLSSGIYFYEMQINGIKKESRRMVLLK